MTILTVRHITTYHYKQPVSFGEHRMMLRPRESHDKFLQFAEAYTLEFFIRLTLGSTTTTLAFTIRGLQEESVPLTTDNHRGDGSSRDSWRTPQVSPSGKPYVP
jgi:hypothetical protein